MYWTICVELTKDHFLRSTFDEDMHEKRSQ